MDIHYPNKKLCLFSSMGNGIKVETDDIAITGRVSIGVKGMAFEKTDYLTGAHQVVVSDAIAMFVSDGSAKILKQSEIQESARNRKGLVYILSKSKTAKLVGTHRLSVKTNYAILTEKDKLQFMLTNALPLDTRTGSGKLLVKEKIKVVYPFVESK